MHCGFYSELEGLKADGYDADFGFLENIPVGDSYYLYDFLHGCCDQFAAGLSDYFGYEVEYILAEDANYLVHAYCICELANGAKAYIDARGITTDAKEFFNEFSIWCNYDVDSGALCGLRDVCQVFRHKNTNEMYSDENRKPHQDKDLFQFLKDYRSYYDIQLLEKEQKAMLDKNIDYKVKGYTNKWSLIDTQGGYGLLENSTYGDETCYLVVDLNQEPEMRRYMRSDGELVYLPTIMEVLGETFDGLETALDDLGIEIPVKVDSLIASASDRSILVEHGSTVDRSPALDDKDCVEK